MTPKCRYCYREVFDKDNPVYAQKIYHKLTKSGLGMDSTKGPFRPYVCSKCGYVEWFKE